MVRGYFFDIDTIVTLDSKAWVVDKSSPNIPILKISKPDLSLIQSGIFRKQGHKIEFNGKVFWLPTDLFNKLKIKTKNYKTDFSNLAISLQEFYNKDLIEKMDFHLDLSVINRLKNNSDDIWMVSSSQTKNNLSSIISKIQDELRSEGITIKNFYFINENVMNGNADEVLFKKGRLFIQHLVGYKTDGDKFIDEKITKYDEVSFYDNSLDTLKIFDLMNPLLQSILKNTDVSIRRIIEEDLEKRRPYILINRISDNQMNKIETKKSILSISKIIKTFESFRKFSGDRI